MLLDGFHAVKHALRFGAQVDFVAVADEAMADELVERLAPDIREALRSLTRVTTPRVLAEASGHFPHTKMLALARYPEPLHQRCAALDADGHLVLLEDPRNLGNLGAVVRVAAAANAGAVLTTGRHEPWDPLALRGSAGLHFALPVVRFGSLDEVRHRPIVALDPDGERIGRVAVPRNAVLAFGTERDGLTHELIESASMTLSLPMRAGVSSLNLATSVAATLFLLNHDQTSGSGSLER